MGLFLPHPETSSLIYGTPGMQPNIQPGDKMKANGNPVTFVKTPTAPNISPKGRKPIKGIGSLAFHGGIVIEKNSCRPLNTVCSSASLSLSCGSDKLQMKINRDESTIQIMRAYTHPQRPKSEKDKSRHYNAKDSVKGYILRVEAARGVPLMYVPMVARILQFSCTIDPKPATESPDPSVVGNIKYFKNKFMTNITNAKYDLRFSLRQKESEFVVAIRDPTEKYQQNVLFMKVAKIQKFPELVAIQNILYFIAENNM
jgi:hypothetical protein